MGLAVENLVKSFGNPPNEIVRNLSFTVDDGELLAITGRSGSGKSTLLYLLSSLDSPTSGHVIWDGENIQTWDHKRLHHFRNRHVGFVFQFHYLLPELTALENVAMPARKAGLWDEKLEEAKNILTEFGLGHRLHHKPSQMSGGEQQRVAIARALVMNPRFVFADEPTGNLDSVNGQLVMDIFLRLNREKKTTIVYVTHDAGYARLARRCLHLVDGQIEA